MLILYSTAVTSRTRVVLRTPESRRIWYLTLLAEWIGESFRLMSSWTFKCSTKACFSTVYQFAESVVVISAAAAGIYTCLLFREYQRSVLFRVYYNLLICKPVYILLRLWILRIYWLCCGLSHISVKTLIFEYLNDVSFLWNNSFVHFCNIVIYS